MNQKKFTIITAMVLILSMVLCGCGSVKSAWIAGRFAAAIKRDPITAVGGSLQGEITGKTLGVDSRSALEAEFETTMDPETGRSFSDIQSAVTVLGLRVPQHLEVYQLPGETSTDYYVHLIKPSLWARGSLSSDQIRFLDLDPALLMLIMERAADTAEIQTVEDQGVKNHLLKLTFQAADFQAFLESSGLKLPDEAADADFTGVTVPVEVEINSQTGLPQRLRIEVRGLQGRLLTSLLEAAGRELKGVEPESGTITLEADRFGYGPQTVPQLPQEAVEGADQMEELQAFFRKLFQ